MAADPHVHEYSIVQALLDRVESEASARGALTVARVEIALGRLSGVEPELLRSAFELFRERTVCASAALAIRSLEPTWACGECAEPVPPGGPLRCPACGKPARLVSGDEILLERLELEVA